MERRDIIKDQIEQLGRVLGKILANFLGLKSAGKVSEGMEISNEKFKNELDLDLDRMVGLTGGELRDYLKDRKFIADHIETLAEYLEEAGGAMLMSNEEEGRRFLRKAVELLDIADEVSNTVSFERMNRKVKIGEMLERGTS